MGNEERKEERKCTRNVGEKEEIRELCVCSCGLFFAHKELMAYTTAQQDHEHMKREGGECERVDVNLQGNVKFFCCMLCILAFGLLLPYHGL